jgi:hypothetical protein
VLPDHRNVLTGLQNYSKATLLESESKVASEPKGEELMDDLLNQPYEFAISIYPYRKTDLGHFRDSFLRHISNRMKDALASQKLSEADAEGVSASLDDLRVCFPKASAPIGEPLVLLRRADGSLAFEWKGATLGIIKNRWTAKHLLLAYFSRKNVISQKVSSRILLIELPDAAAASRVCSGRFRGAFRRPVKLKSNSSTIYMLQSSDAQRLDLCQCLLHLSIQSALGIVVSNVLWQVALNPADLLVAFLRKLGLHPDERFKGRVVVRDSKVE